MCLSHFYVLYCLWNEKLLFPLIHFLSGIFYWRCQSLSSCVQVLINLLFQRSLERDLSTYVVATLSSLSIKLIFLVRNCLSKHLSPIWEVFCHATKRGKWGLRVVPDVCLGATMLKSIGLLFLEWLEIIRIFYPMETRRVVAKAPFLRNENYRQHPQIGEHVINGHFFYFSRSVRKWEPLCSKLLQHSQWNVRMWLQSRVRAQWQWLQLHR